jgi:hypothetical protein
MVVWKDTPKGRLRHSWNFEKDGKLVTQCKVCLKLIKIPKTLAAAGAKHASIEEAKEILGAESKLLAMAANERARPILCDNCYANISYNPKKVLYEWLFADMDKMASFCAFFTITSLFCF